MHTLLFYDLKRNMSCSHSNGGMNYQHQLSLCLDESLYGLLCSGEVSAGRKCLFLTQLNNHSIVALQLFSGAVDSTLETEEVRKSLWQAWDFAFTLVSKQNAQFKQSLCSFCTLLQSPNNSSICHRWFSILYIPLQLAVMPTGGHSLFWGCGGICVPGLASTV